MMMGWIDAGSAERPSCRTADGLRSRSGGRPAPSGRSLLRKPQQKAVSTHLLRVLIIGRTRANFKWGPSVKRWGRPSTRRATASSDGPRFAGSSARTRRRRSFAWCGRAGPGCRRLGSPSRGPRAAPRRRLASLSRGLLDCLCGAANRVAALTRSTTPPLGLRSLRSRASLSRSSRRSPSPPSPTSSPRPW